MNRKSRTFIASPPGMTIREQLTERDMSQKEFASRMDMSEKHISRLINGEVQLTSDVAVRLEIVLGPPAHFWSNLENIYREKLTKIRIENEMDADLSILKKIPYREMAEYGWIEDTCDPKEQVQCARRFFEVVRLDLLNKPQLFRVAWRGLSEQKDEKSRFALLSWIQKAKLEARNISLKTFSTKKLEDCLSHIKELQTQEFSEACSVLKEELAECGVALVILPHIGDLSVHGATFCDGSKIVIGLATDGEAADRFWFSLFHELGHIVLGHIDQPEGISGEDEAAADSFAERELGKLNSTR